MTIAGRPTTVAEAVLVTLRDFALAYKRHADEVLSSRSIFERSLAELSPEAIVIGGQRAIENERYCPSVYVLKRYAVEEQGKITAATRAVIPRRETDGTRCHICGAEAVERVNEFGRARLIMEHDRAAHRVPNYMEAQ